MALSSKALGEQPAFPAPGTMYQGATPGMTLRQYYAGVALQGLLAQDPASLDRVRLTPTQRAVAFADDLLAELNK
jgi:hypothetical protein